MQKKKRIGVFVYYDEEGIVDDYILYLLDDIKRELSRLIIVCNGEIKPQEKKKLLNYTQELIERNNEGYDGGAYKHILINYLSSNEYKDYDELVLFNDTFFGPFYPFEKIFQTMRGRDCDIWGLSILGKCLFNNIERKEHIQSYFLVIKKQVLLSKSFSEFWYNLKKSRNFDEAVSNFEIGFSEKMLEAGFKLDAFLKLEKFMSKNPIDNFDYSQSLCGEMVVNYGFPVFKRKNVINQTPLNNEICRALSYIYLNYNYPFDNILKSIFRKFTLSQLDLDFGLNNLFTGKAINAKFNGRFACVLHSDKSDFMDDLQNIFDDLSIKIDVFFVDDDPVIYLKKYPQMLNDYDFIGIMGDKPYPDVGSNRLDRYQNRNNKFKYCLLCERIFDYLSEVLEYQKTIGLVYADLNSNDISLQVQSEKYWTYWVKCFLNDCGIKEYNDEDSITVFGQESFWCEAGLLRDMIELSSDDQIKLWYLSLPYIAQYYKRGTVFYYDGKTVSSSITDYKHKLMESLMSDE